MNTRRMKEKVIRNPDEMVLLRDKAKEIGETTKFSASEAAKALDHMDIAGWKTEDMLGGIEGVMNLAAAFGEDFGTVANSLAEVLTAFEDTERNKNNIN